MFKNCIHVFAVLLSFVNAGISGTSFVTIFRNEICFFCNKTDKI